MIFHLAEPDDWAARTDEYVAPSLDSEGFIHLSTADQLDRVAAAIFPGRTDLVLLTVDERLLPMGVEYEDLSESGEAFPHLYGPVPVSAITEVSTYRAPESHDPDRYTHGHHEAVLTAHRARTAAESAQYLLPRLTRGDRLLDIGCGPGTITADLAAIVAPGEVVAIDREPLVVEEARHVAMQRGLDNLAIEVGDGYSLRFEDDTFDVVHAHQVLHHLSNPVAALAEMRRVARPGGLVAVREADYGAMTWYPEDDRLDRWREIYHTAARSNGAEPDAGRRLLAWAHAAGFTDVTASASVSLFADARGRALWSDSWARRMTESPVAEQAIAESIASHEELQEVAEAFRAWNDHPDAWFTVLNGEILAIA